MNKLNPDKLINWGELSRILAKDRSSVTPKRISKKNKLKVDALIKAIEKWYNELI